MLLEQQIVLAKSLITRRQLAGGENAARLNRDPPGAKVMQAACYARDEQPLLALSEAIKAKNGSRFTRAFADLAESCSSCHVAANVGFITIQIPTSSPFSTQLFMPKQK
jgi:hypothetical protein